MKEKHAPMENIKIIGILLLILGIIGIILPIMPGFIFVLAGLVIL